MATASITPEPSFPKPRLFRALLRWALFFLLLAGFGYVAMFLQGRRLRQVTENRPYIDRLILPRTEYAKTLSFGYDMFMADFLYLRSIQAFGGQWRQGMPNIQSIYHYFYTVTELDPKFTDAYKFGSMIIGEEGKDPKRAIKLNEKGWLADPETYVLAYWNAYTSFYVLKDPKMAKMWVRLAKTAPDCPEFVRRFEYYFDKESGDFQAALEKWLWEYLNALDNRDNTTLGIASRQIVTVTDEWNLKILNKALEKYYNDNGRKRIPADLDELAQKGYLNNYKRCDYYTLSPLLDEAVNQMGKKTALLDSFTKACLSTASGIPVCPNGEKPGDDFYFIRKGTRPSEFEAAIKSEALIYNLQSAKAILEQKVLPYIRATIAVFHKKNKRYPNPLDEAFPKTGGVNAFDPLTGKWNYDPKTGVVQSPTFPKL